MSALEVHADSNTKTHKPFVQEVQMVQVLLLLLVVPEKYEETVI